MIDRLKDRLQGISERTKYAIVLLLALLAIYATARLQEAAAAAMAESERARQSFNRVAGGVLDADWSRRAALASQIRSEWDGRFWDGETPGLVAARVQSALSGIAAPFNLSRASINVDPTLVETGPGVSIRFRVTARTNDVASAVDLLTAIAAHPQYLIVDDVTFRVIFGGQGQIVISGVAPFRPGSGAAQGGES